jgi:protein ImuB
MSRWPTRPAVPPGLTVTRPQIPLPLPGGAEEAQRAARGPRLAASSQALARGQGPGARGQEPGARGQEPEARGSRLAASSHGAYRPLWLCLHLPDVLVEQLGPTDAPRAVVERSSGRPCIVACDVAARAAGIQPGQSEHAARALIPELCTVARNIPRERAALERLAAWALQYGPVVSPEPPQDLFLEVRGSLKLFGGIERLSQRIRADLATLGHRAQVGVAPTASAARILARAGPSAGAAVEDAARLPGVIGALPLTVMAWDDAVLSRARGFGARELRDLIRLPRDGLAKRLGRRVMDDLDRALGKRPDPRQSYQPPSRYRGRLDLVHEQEDLGRIRAGLERLLAELAGMLLARQCGVQRLRLVLMHRDQPDSRLELELAGPSRDPAHLSSLFAERMANWTLPAPVTELVLISGPLFDLDPGAGSLFHRSALPPAETDAGADVPALVERLQARLGPGRVRGLAQVAEHRPEAAWHYRELGVGAGAGCGPALDRPLWLLVAPELLTLRAGRPCWGGPLTVISGPERIESGWWDGRDVRRDYYVMADRDGLRVWVFRERGGGRRWFLHGLFA